VERDLGDGLVTEEEARKVFGLEREAPTRAMKNTGGANGQRSGELLVCRA
jgi:hypothetical protein